MSLPKLPLTFAEHRRLSVEGWKRALHSSSDLEQPGYELRRFVLRYAITHIPAYCAFLESHRISVHSALEMPWQDLPLATKDGLIRAHDLPELLPQRDLREIKVVSTSSGTTGLPFFWPRNESLEAETAAVHEFMLDILGIERDPWLVSCSYALGTYVAGVITLHSFFRNQEKGRPVTLVTPGINLDLIRDSLRGLLPTYKRLIVVAYPPVIKAAVDWLDSHARDTADTARAFSGRFIAAGEAFSEAWREYVAKKLRCDTSILRVGLNIYGSADAGILAHETPVSIQVRRWASSDSQLCRDLFGREDLPSLASYHPYFKFFEVVDERLVFTAFSALPLVRYVIGDRGGVLQYERVQQICRDHGYDLHEALSDEGCSDFHYRLPMVYLWGRGAECVTYIGLNVYPEPVQKLLSEPQWLPLLSGRFRFEVKDDDNFDQVFTIHCELAPNVEQLSPTQVADLQMQIDTRLQEANIEYREARRTFAKARPPEIITWQHGDPRKFPPTIKQRAT